MTTTELLSPVASHELGTTFGIWYMHRHPGHKIADYEKATQYLGEFGSVEEFYAWYAHLQRADAIPHISDLSIFRKGVRPVWEDDANVKGGKWLLRVRKHSGLMPWFWESLLLALISDDFGDAAQDITGVVLSIRHAEDTISVWNSTASDGRVNLKIKETLRKCLNLGPDAELVYKTHDDSKRDSSHRTSKMGEKSERPHSYFHHHNGEHRHHHGSYFHHHDRYPRERGGDSETRQPADGAMTEEVPSEVNGRDTGD